MKDYADSWGSWGDYGDFGRGGPYTPKPPSPTPKAKPKKPTPVDVSISTSTSYKLSDEDWESLSGSNMHAMMMRQRCFAVANADKFGSVMTNNITRRMRSDIFEWLKKSCSNFYYVGEPDEHKMSVAVYFLGKADSVNFFMFWNDYKFTMEP